MSTKKASVVFNNLAKASLDIWRKDESLEASDNLPDPDVIAQEIVEELEAALEQLCATVGDLGERSLYLIKNMREETGHEHSYRNHQNKTLCPFL